MFLTTGMFREIRFLDGQSVFPGNCEQVVHGLTISAAWPLVETPCKQLTHVLEGASLMDQSLLPCIALEHPPDLILAGLAQTSSRPALSCACQWQ